VPDALDAVLRLVAEGRLTAAEAAPIIAALDRSDRAGQGDREAGAADDGSDRGSGRTAGRSDEGSRSGGRAVRLEVFEDGRRVVNLRLPAALGSAAMLRIPGLSPAQVDRIRGALADGVRGTLLETGDDEGGVRIVLD